MRIVQHKLSTYKEQESGPDWEPATPSTRRGLGPETEWNVDRCRTGLWTTAQWDFSCPQMVCNSSKTEQNGGGGCDWSFDKNRSTWMSKPHCFDILSEFQQDLEDV